MDIKVGLLLLGALAACRRDGGHGADKPVGRTWPTPPIEEADGPIARKLPRVVYRGGRFLHNPRLVTITWRQDDPTLVSRLEAFGSTIASSRWWRTVVDSYCTKPDDCIGDGQASPAIRLDESLAADVRDTDIESLLAAKAKAGALGPIGPETLLVAYVPSGVNLSDAFSPRYCAGGPRAFHRALGEGKRRIAYAVVARCGDEAELTATASHEILEATTNPDPSARGFAFEQGSTSVAFTAAGIEPVDPCGLITMDGHRSFEGGFVVQRAWSNREAARGRDPCVPARADRPYAALVPREPAVRLATDGESATIELDAVADRETAAWAASAFDLSGHLDHDKYVDVTLDKSTVATGQTASVTITVRKRNPKGLSLVGLVSTVGVDAHMWPIAIVMR